MLSVRLDNVKIPGGVCSLPYLDGFFLEEAEKARRRQE